MYMISRYYYGPVGPIIKKANPFQFAIHKLAYVMGILSLCMSCLMHLAYIENMK